jgi:hypothetical protein
MTWILLPNGYDGAGRLKLSLVARPRSEGGATTLAAVPPLLDWPARVAELGPLRIVSDDGTVDVAATVVPPAPDRAVWAGLFPPTTPVRRPGPKADALPAVIAGPSVVDAAREIDDLFAAFVDASPGGWPSSDDDVVSPLRALAAPDRTAFRSRGERLAAQTRLTRQGRSAEAATLAIGHVADHLRERSARAARAAEPGPEAVGPPVGQPDPVAAIRRIDEVDFHQVVGLALGHPLLARRLGLVLDLRIPAFAGPRTLRAVRADGSPLDGPVPRRQPWSRVIAEPGPRRFVMVRQPDAPTEVVDGMLDLDGAADDVLVTTTDVLGVSIQLDALARSRLSDGNRRAGEPVPLPPTRDVGFTLARADRGVSVAAHSLQRAQVLDPTTSGPDTVLFADDVTTGYRLDVATDGGGFRSLMRRRSTYTVGGATFSGDEEGRTEALAVVADTVGREAAALLAGEEIAAWSGWGLGVPRPGPTVLGDVPGAPPTTVVEGVPAPGFDLRHDVAVIPGSLPKLRYGHEYEFRARAVDLAGNTHDPDEGDRAHSVSAGHYLRREKLPSPDLVPRRRFTFGESQAHLVVRSNGKGERVGPTCERHLVLPKTSQHKAETHGRFDAAFGPGTPAAVRDRILAQAGREAGTLLDPTVPGPDGQPIPTPGLDIVTNDPTAEPDVTLPLPAGEPLPNGVYAIHDTDEMVTPWLADPMAGGVSLIGLPDHAGPVVVPATGQSWPDLTPTRLVVRPRLDGTTTTTKLSADGQVLELDVPPGTKAEIEVASAVAPDVLDQVDLGGHAPAELLDGTGIQRCARQKVTVVHAVAQPVADPTLPGGPTLGTLGRDQTSVDLKATVGFHPATTGEVHLQAEWVDVDDTGSGPVGPERKTATLGSALVSGGAATAPMDVTLELGDTRRHDLTVRPAATSPFREYFDPGTLAVRAGQPATVTVKNRSRPPAPVVHSVVPLFSWARSTTNGVYKSTRKTVGVRVVLDRPWNVTGVGERLGVVVHRLSTDAGTAGGKKLRELVSRWGTDPLQEQQPQATEHLLAGRFGGQSDLAGAVTLPDGPPSTTDVPVPKVDIVAYPVDFDPERDRWVADVQFGPNGLPENTWPFLRLALVRFQPQSLTGCHLSPVTIAPFVQVPPTRTIEARSEGPVGVRVKVTGPKAVGTTFTLRQERRIPEPSVRTLDLAVDATAGWQVTPVAGTGLANLVLQPVGPTPPPAVLSDLLDGRVVVDEVQEGLPLRRNGSIDRVVFTETFDRSAVGMQGVPSASRA